MPIPGFDRHGNLSIGDLFGRGPNHSVTITTLGEVHDRFVRQIANSSSRSEIWDGWLRHRIDTEGVGVQYTTLVDGSFVTTKLDPGDVDICILLDADEVNQLGTQARLDLGRLLAGPACKADYRCDVYPLMVHPFRDPRFPATVERLSYWTRVFGIDRAGRQKSFLLVNERGVL